jgi:hypothetical protein
MPSNAHLMVGNNDEVHPGDVIAKIPRETTKTKDITGGLPRVVELFEARKPRETAVISEIDGVVRQGGIVKGMRKILVVPDDGGEAREYSLPRGVHVNVQEGDRVSAGEPLMDGPRNPHDILAVLGEKELQGYLVNEVQEVYRLQGVGINDKHIEVIVRQMMRWVKVEDGQVPVPGRQGRRRSPGAPDARTVRVGVGVDHQGADRGVNLGQDGLPAWPQGKRHDGPSHSGRHGLRRLPRGSYRAGRATATTAAVSGRAGAAA